MQLTDLAAPVRLFVFWGQAIIHARLRTFANRRHRQFASKVYARLYP